MIFNHNENLLSLSNNIFINSMSLNIIDFSVNQIKDIIELTNYCFDGK